MTYEQKMSLLSRVKPEAKDMMLLRILRGETIDITKDEDLFFQVNKDRVTLEQFVNRDKFRQDAKEMQWTRDALDDKRHGRTKTGKGHLLGEIPADIYFNRKEFSDPCLSQGERLKNMKSFFNQFPAFRAGEGRL